MAATVKQVNCYMPPKDWDVIDAAFAALVARKGIKDGNGKRVSKNAWLKSILVKEARAELRRSIKDDGDDTATVSPE